MKYKNVSKRFVCFLMALVFSAALMPVFEVSAAKGDEFSDTILEYKVLDEDNKTAYVSGMHDTTVTNVTIPNIVSNGTTDYTVTRIGGSAFLNKRSLQSITFNESITRISANAFQGCSSLENIEFNRNLKSIKESAFESCTALETITLPSSVTELNSNIFLNCSALKTVNLSACTNLTLIPTNAFASCTKLNSVSLPASLESISGDAFLGCTLLSDIDFAEESGFMCEDGIVFDSGKSSIYIYLASNSRDRYVIPDTVKIIGQSAFYRPNLKEIVIPTTLQTIDDGAFSKNLSITNIIYYLGKSTDNVVTQLNNSTKNYGISVETDCALVTYDANGGIIKPNGSGDEVETYQDILYGSDNRKLLANEPTKVGCVFKGWSDGTSTYAEGAAYNASGSVTLTAQWESAEPKVDAKAVSAPVKGLGDISVGSDTKTLESGIVITDAKDASNTKYADDFSGYNVVTVTAKISGDTTKVASAHLTLTNKANGEQIADIDMSDPRINTNGYMIVQICGYGIELEKEYLAEITLTTN